MNLVIRVLLLAYPPRWRQRYGPEVEGLAADVGLSLGVAVDLVRSGMRQRADEVRSSAHSAYGMRQPETFAWIAALVLAPTATFVAGSLLAYGLGVGAVRGVMDTAGAWLDAAGRFNGLLVIAAPASAALALAPLIRVQRQSGGSADIRVALTMRTANLVVAGLAFAVSAALAWFALGEISLGG